MHVLILRHASTSWNEQRRIQGSSDVPLSTLGIAQAESMCLPERYRQQECFCSPLLRCRQTAFYLGLRSIEFVGALAEMSWGEWEGSTLEQMRRRLGPEYREQTARGLDFRPAGGESPREVGVRVRRWIREHLAAKQGDAINPVLVTHKGVMRAVLALVTGWDMRTGFVEPIDWRCAIELALQGDKLQLVSLNVPLSATSPVREESVLDVEEQNWEEQNW